jgi:hypothetical protein
MSEVFLRSVKQLALQRLRGQEPQLEIPKENQNNNNNNNLPDFIWARPQVTDLWTSMEQALIENSLKKSLSSSASPSRVVSAASIISPSRDKNSASNTVLNNVVPYIVYRQTVCRELAKELGYYPESLDQNIDDENISLSDRAKILSMYRQHLACGPATYFDAWRNQNREVLANVNKNENNSNNTREPTLVDVMSQIGAVSFFADLRSLLEGIRNERLMKQQQAQNQTEKDVKASSIINPVFKNLQERLVRKYNIANNTKNETEAKTNNNHNNNNNQPRQDKNVIPPLPVNNEDVQSR